MKSFTTLFSVFILLAVHSAELCNSAKWQQGKMTAGWNTYTYKGKSNISILPENICRITADKTGRGYIRWQKKIALPAGTVFRFSGRYRTENVEFSGKGFIKAELQINRSLDRSKRKNRTLRLTPSSNWKTFSENVISQAPVENCSVIHLLYDAKGTVEFADLKLETLQPQEKGKLDKNAITVWRECEEVFTGGGLSPGGGASGRGKQYISQGKFSYRFKPFAETDPETLLPRPRKFYIWVKLYGYVDKTRVQVTLDNKPVYTFDTVNTEKTVNKRIKGEYYWQRAGVFSTTGSPHELVFTGKARMCFDAMIFTTDPAYIPAGTEARNSKNNNYFTDLKLPVSIKTRYPVNGVATNSALPLTFEFTTPGRKKIYKKGTVKLELPPGVKLVEAVSHWSAKTWKSDPKIADYLKVRTQLQKDGSTHCEIDLSCISLSFQVFLQAEKELAGKKVPLYFSFELGKNKQPREKIYLDVMTLKETKPFKNILLGTEELFQGFYSDFPDLFETIRKHGINFLLFKHYRRGKNPAAWQKLSAGAGKSGTTLGAAYSPRFPFNRKQGRAVDINGKSVREPGLIFRPESPWDKKDLDAISALGKDFNIVILDDENTNRRWDKIDYHPDVLAAFDKYRKAKNLPAVDIKAIVRAKKFDSAEYLSWVDFKCELMAEHYKYYDKAVKSFNPHAVIIPCILKEDTGPADLRRSSYWDYRKLLPYCPQIMPMIYTYMGIRDSAKVGNIMDMHNREAGRPVISPYLLSEHFDFGIVRPENKPMIKYQIWESLMGQAKYILFFSGSGTFNPVNLQYIAEGVATALPYEEFFLKGKPVTLKHSPDWLRVRALELDGKLLIYYANYANDTGMTGTVILPDGRNIKVNFKKDRAGFILTKTN